MTEKDSFQNARPSNTATKGRPPRNNGSGNNSRGVTKELTVRSEVRAPAWTCAIQEKEVATAADVVIGIFYLFDVTVYALIDPKSTHSYICTTLDIDKNAKAEDIKKSIEKTSELTPSFKLVRHTSICGECGFKDEQFDDKCPKCKSPYVV